MISSNPNPLGHALEIIMYGCHRVKAGQFIPLLDRYLLTALWPPFMGGIGVFSAIGLAAAVLFDLLRQVSDAQLPLAIALAILGLQLPYFVSLSIPMSVLFACLLTFSRLNTDRELMALQAAGVCLSRLIRTSLYFALLALILMLGLTEGLVPTSQYQAQHLLIQTVQQGQLVLKERHLVYQDKGPQDNLHRLLYAQASNGQTLYGITLIDFTVPEKQTVMTAQSATWDIDNHLWLFRHGTIYAATVDGQDQHLIQFETHQLQLPPTYFPMERALDPNVMTLTQSWQVLARLRQQGATPLQLRTLTIQVHRKMALPFTVLVFALVGSALGISHRQGSVSNGFGLTLILILGQYLLIFLADLGGRIGWITPWLGAWLPNIVTGGLGMGLLFPLLGLSLIPNRSQR